MKTEHHSERPMGYGYNSSDTTHWTNFIPECECNEEHNKLYWTSREYKNFGDKRCQAKRHELECNRKLDLKRRVHFAILSGINTFQRLLLYFWKDSSVVLEQTVDELMALEWESKKWTKVVKKG